jgi:hypothetical protein
MKIISLTSENVKRIKAVHITPTRALVVIGGRNGQGKSSALDSIEYALGGDPDVKMPVRRGEKNAKIVADLGDIVVRRTFTAAGGTSLTVTNADGVKQSGPQAILDALVGRIAFDPLAFARQKPREQAETLRTLVGLDFTRLDCDRATKFAERTDINRTAKAYEARMNGMARHADAPESETSAASILAEQTKAQEQNLANAEARHKAAVEEDRVEDCKRTIADWDKAIQETKDEIAVLNATLKSQEKESAEALGALPKLQKSAETMQVSASKLADIDLAQFTVKVNAVEAVNLKVRENKARAEVVKQFKAASAQADKLTTEIEALDSKRRQTITDAKFPISGLSFDTAGGVTLDGLPFEQASSAEQLRVSVAIGIALNPKLRVLLIRDGSLLDPDAMKLLAEMADKAGAQVWIERVGTDSMTSVVIEDGAVIEQAEATPKEGSLL